MPPKTLEILQRQMSILFHSRYFTKININETILAKL